ncbi:MAG: dienelactone hydrolase family protein [Candidatus Obscuribacterales bacterium]|nr:dienelactone hydrolase family protein [Candidatus Obscuribacterales bacterium]
MGLKLSMESLKTDFGYMPVFTAQPNDNNKYPGLIIIHEIFGLDEHIKDLAQRFARQGLRVWAPDLFWLAAEKGLDRTNLDQMRAFFFSLADSQVISLMQKVLQSARSNEAVIADKVGAVGFCMGGALAFMLAGRSKNLSFVIDYYGRVLYPETSDKKPLSPIDYAEGINCPVLALFSGIDPIIPLDQIQLFEDKLSGLGKSLELKVYDNAEHAFFNDRREHYNPQAAEDAWALTLAFITKHTGLAVSAST